MSKKVTATTCFHHMILAALACVPLTAQERTSGNSADSELLRAHASEYAALSLQVKHIHGNPTAGAAYHSKARDAITEKLRAIVQTEVISHLDLSPHTDKVVQSAIAEVQAFPPNSDPAYITNAPFVSDYQMTGTASSGRVHHRRRRGLLARCPAVPGVL